MRLGFKVSGSVGNFSMIYGDLSLSVPEIPVLLPSQVSTFSAPRDSVLPVTSTRVNVGVAMTGGSLGDAGGIGTGLCC